MRDVVAQHAPLEISARIVATPGTDMRRYNKPQKYEPAVVFVSSDGTPPLDRDIVVWPRDPHYKTYHVSDKPEHIDLWRTHCSSLMATWAGILNCGMEVNDALLETHA